MDEPWKVYFTELRRRGTKIPPHAPGGDERMAEAAHDAYRATADRLLDEAGYTEDESLALTRRFGGVVQSWMRDSGSEWDDLERRLREAQAEWDELRETDGRGAGA